MTSKQGCITAAAIFILVLGYLVYDNLKFESRAISDCTISEIFVLPKNVLHPSKCKVKVKGNLDGLAKINKCTIGSGKIDTILYYGDWYDDPFQIEYENISVARGQLKVFYKFY